jgi:pre-rRNA-processing protein TSR2
MDEAPALVRAPKEKVIPEVDDDGFQKVVGKKRTGGKEKGKSWM